MNAHAGHRAGRRLQNSKPGTGRQGQPRIGRDASGGCGTNGHRTKPFEVIFFGTWRRQILENTFDFGEWQVLAPLIERTSSNPNCRRRRIHWTILSSYNAHKRSNETTMTRCRQTMTRELKNLTFQTIQSQPIGVWGCSVSSASEHPAILKILRFCHVGTQPA